MKIKRTSNLTGVTRTLEIDVTDEQIRRWESGTLIQDAMPHLSSSEREFIMTGATDEEWEEMFGPKPELDAECPPWLDEENEGEAHHD